jgi:hypothetical protein
MFGARFFRGQTTTQFAIVPFVALLPQQVTMTLSIARVAAARTISRKAPVQEQKRGIVNYLTNYPDKVSVLGWSDWGSDRDRRSMKEPGCI